MRTGMLGSPYRIAVVLAVGVASLIVSLNLGSASGTAQPDVRASPHTCRDPALSVQANRGFTKVDARGDLVCPYLADGLTAFIETCDASYLRRDRGGVPLVPLADRWVYNPGTIAMCGLGQYNLFLVTKSKDSLAYAVTIADWLVAHQDRSGAWLYGFDYPVGAMGKTLRAPWASSFAQGVGMSLLSRVYRATGQRRYLSAAVRAAEPLTKDVAAGGLATRFLAHTFYEEYPTRPPTLALEGFMVTLVGLYDLESTLATGPTELAPDRRRVARLLQQGLRTLRFALPLYDLGTISAYHLGHLTNPPRPPAAFPAYHPRHVLTLRLVDSFAPSRIFRYYGAVWSTYKVPGTAP